MNQIQSESPAKPVNPKPPMIKKPQSTLPKFIRSLLCGGSSEVSEKTKIELKKVMEHAKESNVPPSKVAFICSLKKSILRMMQVLSYE
ncbi:hypothetical protein AMTR_s00072p00076980 [Amborella trichopoda]|uniref:Uncharacterized protein n=1 Tax=Amborella trichopoda TaxID=13333 RepID=W1NTE6_AMBTC|nr:hypothetical protein AMTR_s00072p00076980 [Amborella trichopoda]